MDLLILSSPFWGLHFLGLIALSIVAFRRLSGRQAVGWRLPFTLWAFTVFLLAVLPALISVPHRNLQGVALLPLTAPLAVLPYFAAGAVLHWTPTWRTPSSRVGISALAGLVGLTTAALLFVRLAGAISPDLP